VSEQIYNGLPTEEKPYWHPHNYEILSGTLRMPGLPDIAEKEALQDKMNSYGKTWHTWMTGMHGGRNDQLPLGPPQLQWSFNRDGEALPGLVEARDKRMSLDTAAARRDREELTKLAKPQGGVDALAGMFSGAQPPMQGITDSGDPATKAVPKFSMDQPRMHSAGR
jgi:hypothetical protein